MEKKTAKIRGKLAKVEKEIAKWNGAKTDPANFFATQGFSKFNDGLPTHDQDGKALSKKAAGKAKKALGEHTKVHQQLRKNLADNPNFLTDLEAVGDGLQSEITSIESA